MVGGMVIEVDRDGRKVRLIVYRNGIGKVLFHGKYCKKCKLLQPKVMVIASGFVT